MKTIAKTLSLALIIGIAAACSSGGGETTKTSEAKDATASAYDMVYMVDNKQSSLEWEGYKPTGQHNGTVDIVSGNLMIKDDQIVGGEFVMDLTSVTVLDLEDPGMNKKLTDHLKSSDFFEVETYPEATFEITSVESALSGTGDPAAEKGDVKTTHMITGNLTVKGISRSIAFNALVDTKNGQIKALSNMFFLDRTEWNVQYKSKKIFANLKDNFINDEMGIKIKLVATPQTDEMANL
jgi:polyisoprenoid-binding protein YceI